MGRINKLNIRLQSIEAEQRKELEHTMQVNQALRSKTLQKSLGAELQDPYSHISQFTNSLINTQTNFSKLTNQENVGDASQRTTQTKFRSTEPP